MIHEMLESSVYKWLGSSASSLCLQGHLHMSKLQMRHRCQ